MRMEGLLLLCCGVESMFPYLLFAALMNSSNSS